VTSDTAERISYWSRVASEKRFSHPLRLDWLDRYSTRQARILDYGCGYGRTAGELKHAGFVRVIGADFSEAMLGRARVEIPGTSWVQNDGRSLPFQDSCFDVILLFAVLTCIPDSNEQEYLLAEVERVLRSGGLLYVSDLLVNDDRRNQNRYRQALEKYQCYGVFELPEGVVVRHHRREWIEQLLSPFKQLEWMDFTVTTMNGNESAAFQYLGRKAN
jgi:ubiquinone/menaquinone biosynthesis C-methylase UbiE